MIISICFHAWQNVLTVWKNSFKELKHSWSILQQQFIFLAAIKHNLVLLYYVHAPNCYKKDNKLSFQVHFALNSNYPTQFLTFSIKILLKLTKKIVRYLHCRSPSNKKFVWNFQNRKKKTGCPHRFFVEMQKRKKLLPTTKQRLQNTISTPNKRNIKVQIIRGRNKAKKQNIFQKFLIHLQWNNFQT